MYNKHDVYSFFFFHLLQTNGKKIASYDIDCNTLRRLKKNALPVTFNDRLLK